MRVSVVQVHPSLPDQKGWPFGQPFFCFSASNQPFELLQIRTGRHSINLVAYRDRFAYHPSTPPGVFNTFPASTNMMKYLLPATLIAILAPALTAAQNPDIQSLDVQATITGLAQPAQTSITFAEIRFSPMLKEPIVVSGVLGYLGPQALDRHVLIPYVEDTEIRSDSIKVNREGEAERTFALSRAPELQGLLHAFSALLAGDHATADREFTIEGNGTTELWTLQLTPRDKKVRQRMQEIRVDGHGNVPRCFWMSRDSESFSVMLLGVAAPSELALPPTREWLQEKCTT